MRRKILEHVLILIGTHQEYFFICELEYFIALVIKIAIQIYKSQYQLAYNL
jgi:hypothetical protein